MAVCKAGDLERGFAQVEAGSREIVSATGTPVRVPNYSYQNKKATQGDPFILVELQGLEPWTSSMPWKRSSQLSYSP